MQNETVKRKRGRPRKSDFPAAPARPASPPETAEQREIRRSLRRRSAKYKFDLDDYFDDDDELFDTDEDRRRKQKKLNHLLNLQSSPNRDDDEDERPSKNRKIDDYDDDEEVGERRPEEESPPGTPVEALSSVVPLPDKKDLELILNKLQKKDIYGVYAEPVDPEELPDYHEMIKNPMDFATVRSKLGNGSYSTLEQFESDVFLICSNAMQYNEPDTIYHKQARSIQELANRKFSKIRMNIERSEKEMKPEHKTKFGSVWKKQPQRSVSQLVQVPINSDFSAGANLATPIQNISNALVSVGYERPGTVEELAEGNTFLNNNNLDKGEDSLPGKGPMSRFGRKSLNDEENRRATYNISLTHHTGNSESIFSTFDEESKQLVPVGLYSDHSYARSLASFAATLGPVAWKVASKKIKQALPEGVEFGRGWVGEYEPLSAPMLMRENCIVKEPTYFTKVQPAPSSHKFEKNPMVSRFSKESMSLGSPSENNLPFRGAAGIRPPYAPTITFPVPDKEHTIRGNVSQVNPCFLSTVMRPRASATHNYQPQNLQSRTCSESHNKNAMRQVELMNCPLSFRKDAASGNEIAGRETANRKFIGDRFDNTGSSHSNFVKAYYPPEQGHVQMMRMLAQKAQVQEKTSNQSSAGGPHIFPSLPSSSNAAAAAARVWMPVGAEGSRPAPQNTNLQKNQLYADSLYDSTHEASQFRRGFPVSGMQVQVQPDRNNLPTNAFVPQGPLATRVGNTIPFQNQQMVFPMLSPNSSRFQVPPTWWNLNPQMQSRQNPEPIPPDVNVDAQQPDLDLQL